MTTGAQPSTLAARIFGLVIAAGLITASPGSGASLGRAHFRSTGHSSITLRKRLHVNTLITEPGTVEVDWSNLYSFSTTNFSMPSTLKYTPKGPNLLWGRTEYSVAFDSLTAADSGVGRVTQFSQSLTMAATTVLYDGEKLDLAIAPQASFFLRDESGARLGGVAIARYDVGQNSIGTTLSWSGATHPSATNPAGTFDAGLGFGRRLAASGLLGRFTPHVNALWERSTGYERIVSLFEGLEYQITERLAFDVTGQHFGVRGGTPDHQIVVGLTFTVGRID